MWYFSLFFPGGFGYVRPPSIHSDADYGGHAALKEVEGGCRGKVFAISFRLFTLCNPNCPRFRRAWCAEASTKTEAEPQA